MAHFFLFVAHLTFAGCWFSAGHDNLPNQLPHLLLCTQAVVQVDESGTEAAAVTSVVMVTMAATPRTTPPLVRMHKAFEMMLAHSFAGMHLELDMPCSLNCVVLSPSKPAWQLSPTLGPI